MAKSWKDAYFPPTTVKTQAILYLHYGADTVMNSFFQEASHLTSSYPSHAVCHGAPTFLGRAVAGAAGINVI